MLVTLGERLLEVRRVYEIQIPMRSIIIILVLVALYLQYLLWFGQGGIRDVARLKEALSTQTDEMTRLSERNRALAVEVMDLKKGLEAIEERARTEMGMIKQGETFYQVVERPENGSRVVKSAASVLNRE